MKHTLGVGCTLLVLLLTLVVLQNLASSNEGSEYKPKFLEHLWLREGGGRGREGGGRVTLSCCIVYSSKLRLEIVKQGLR